jgi:succinate dehydrogenase/fumarate reductase flavoprotein subunit
LDIELEDLGSDRLSAIRVELQETMWRSAGIVREKDDLDRASARIGDLAETLPDLPVEPHLGELRGMLGTSSLLVEAAAFREESRGAHFRLDHPAVRSRFLGTVIQKRGAPLEFRPIEPARPG